MKKFALACLLSTTCFGALAVQETFTTAGPLDCTAVNVCWQNTSDGLFTLDFAPTPRMSAPSRKGFNVRAPSVELHNANGGVMDLSIMSVAITHSKVFNGSQYIGAVQLEVQDVAGNWAYSTQWSSYVGSPTGIYVIFNGRNFQSPWVRGVQGVRLTGVNGTTKFRVGMMNMTAY